MNLPSVGYSLANGIKSDNINFPLLKYIDSRQN